MKGNLARSSLCSGTTSVDFGSYSSMVRDFEALPLSCCCASKGRREARMVAVAMIVIASKEAALRRKFMGPPRIQFVSQALIRDFPRRAGAQEKLSVFLISCAVDRWDAGKRRPESCRSETLPA